jgi:threonine/homoserine/homoserine lactone efflux protein
VSVEFLLTALVIVATPGTGAVYTLSEGLSRGSRASVLAAFACTLGIIPHLLAAITGLAAVLAASPTAFSILKYLGVAYLVYMAVQTWRDKSSFAAAEEDAPRSSTMMVLRTGVLINLLNPKLTIFFFAFLPQFVPANGSPQVLRMLGLSAVFMLMTFVVFATYGLFAAAFRQHVIERPAISELLKRFFAVSFLALSVRLAFTSS